MNVMETLILLLRVHVMISLESVKNVCTIHLETTVKDAKTGIMVMRFKKKIVEARMNYQ